MADDWSDLRKEIADEGGIKIIAMWELRDLAGWAKLGSNVVVDIANKLRDHGMATLPDGEQLPSNQNAEVQVYSERSRVGRVIKAVLHPSATGLRQLQEIGNEDAGEVLEEIRRLVCLRK